MHQVETRPGEIVGERRCQQEAVSKSIACATKLSRAKLLVCPSPACVPPESRFQQEAVSKSIACAAKLSRAKLLVCPSPACVPLE